MISDQKRFEKLQQQAIAAGLIVGYRPDAKDAYFVLNIADVNSCKRTSDIGRLEVMVDKLLHPKDQDTRYGSE